MIPIILFLLALCPLFHANKVDDIDFDKYHFEGDMLLPIYGGERGMTWGRKFWINDSIPTVLYTIDPPRIDIEPIVKNALANLELKTCFKFVRVPPTDPRQKLFYYYGDGCWSFVGNESMVNQKISIGSGCDNLQTITHETMHALGFPHTQTREDRDDNIILLWQNMRDGAQYLRKESETLGTVYNFKSTMHYDNYMFGNGEGPTFVTRDPSHERLIRQNPLMSQCEAVLINKYYNCFDLMGKNCANRECLNGGFVINDCSCFCPGNYTGARCENFAGAWFGPDVHDRKLDQPGVMMTRNFLLSNPKLTGLTWTRLPRCFYPKLKLLTNDVMEPKLNVHTYRMDNYRYTFRDFSNQPPGRVYEGTGSDVVFKQDIYISMERQGMQAAVDFIPDGTCSTNYTDFTQLICIKQEWYSGAWSYESPNYPNPTRGKIACRLYEPTRPNDLSTYAVTLDYKLEKDDKLEFSHGSQKKLTLTGPVNATTLKFSANQGLELKFKANSNTPGYFKLTAQIQRLPKICNRVTNITDTLIVKQPLTEKYPPCAFAIGTKCNMFFRAEEGKRVKVTFDSMNFHPDEFFVVFTNPRDAWEDGTKVTGIVDPIVADSNELLIAYVLLENAKYTPFQFTISAE